MGNILRHIKHFSRNEDGTSTIEFVIAFPFVFAIVVATFDTGVLMMKYVVLENALDRVVRDVRLTGIADGDAGVNFFKTEVCTIAKLIKDCETSLHVEMTPIDTSSTYTASAVTCVDRNADNPPATTFTVGSPDDIVYIRACLVQDRFFPNALSSIFDVDASGGIQLVADSAYVVEPL
jgi:Flp pilus assembly protein TadG